ncbi:hypothetical protein Trad_1213 [Truepera radiovictrix DSM 17093]|uniref:Yip1 domain-containing protein n=2 Tax=Truepera TaxID=332248 RepID=D7CW73_TRURR|nr:hypothetical protein Trad_1213 [Truepera radiovictrix DSM 17093]
MWRAASAPRAFFGALEPQPPRIPRAALAAALGFAALALALGLGFLRATASDAYAPVLLFALLFGGVGFGYAWGFSSLFVQRPGELDVRAWEVSGWSWSVGLFAALSLLVPLLVFPLPALAVLLAGTLLWHLGVLRVGLSVFLGRPAWRVVVLYALFVYGFPLLILTALLVAFSYVF